MLEETIAPKAVAFANEDKGADRTEVRDARLFSVIGELKYKNENSVRAFEGKNSLLDGKVDGL